MARVARSHGVLAAALLLVTAACDDKISWSLPADFTAEAAAIDNQLTELRCTEHALTGLSAEGGELVACFEGPHVRKLTATHYGEMGRAVEQYYFLKADTLLLVRRRTETYTAPLSGEVSAREEEAFYFDRGRLVFWEAPGKPRWAADSAGAEPLFGSATTKAAEVQDAARSLAAVAREAP